MQQFRLFASLYFSSVCRPAAVAKIAPADAGFLTACGTRGVFVAGMTEPRRRRGAERALSKGPAAIPQLPLRRVRNPYPPMALLSDDQVEAIHQASMHILENFGIEVMSPRALSLFEKAGSPTTSRRPLSAATGWGWVRSR